MSVTKSIRETLAPIHPEGYLFLAIFIVVTLFLGWLWAPPVLGGARRLRLVRLFLPRSREG